MLRINNNNIYALQIQNEITEEEKKTRSELYGGLFKRFSLLFSSQSNWFWFKQCLWLWSFEVLLLLLLYQWLNRRKHIDDSNRKSPEMRSIEYGEFIPFFDLFIWINLDDVNTKSIWTLWNIETEKKNYEKCFDQANFMRYLVWHVRFDSFVRIFLCFSACA